MKKTVYFALTLAASAVASISAPAFAESHALIMSIGNYQNPNANLRGIDIDAANARKIALSMGVNGTNIVEVKDGQLTASGIERAMSDLRGRVKSGDKVFVYYSGHGGQQPSNDSAQCSEGMISYDMQLYTDTKFTSDMQRLASQAGQVIMMNDSCFSGGLVDEAKSALGVRSVGGNQAKGLKLGKSGSLNGDASYTCGNAVNAKMGRNLINVKADGARYIYVAAASDREVAWATSSGSSATTAWLQCLTPSTDRDRSGVLTGEEIRACAQTALNGRFNQTITLVGDRSLPLSLVSRNRSLTPNDAASAVDPAAALEDIRAGASESTAVDLTTSSNRLVIRRDPLNFSLNTSKAGYVYLLHVGSDGKTFDLLFPNDDDKNNYLQAGSHSLPRAGWRVKAGGPVGTSHVLAVVSDTQREFAKGMNPLGAFKSSIATVDAAKNLYSAAANDSAGGRYGASRVVSVQEVIQ